MKNIVMIIFLVGGFAMSGNADEYLKNPDNFFWEKNGTTMEMGDFPFLLYVSTSSKPIVFAGRMDADPSENLVTIYPDGSVKFGPDYKADQAATDFWKTLATVFPQFLRDPNEKRP